MPSYGPEPFLHRSGHNGIVENRPEIAHKVVCPEAAGPWGHLAEGWFRMPSSH